MPLNPIPQLLHVQPRKPLGQVGQLPALPGSPLQMPDVAEPLDADIAALMQFWGQRLLGREPRSQDEYEKLKGLAWWSFVNGKDLGRVPHPNPFAEPPKENPEYARPPIMGVQRRI